jgi:hypothetical protein
MPEVCKKEAIDAMKLPKQFYDHMLLMVGGMSDLFPECDPLKNKKELLVSIGATNEAMHTMLINQWWTECKPHIKLIDKKDHTVFKELRKSHFVGDLELHKKWKDKRMSMEDRSIMWKYIGNMTQMSQIQAGDAPMVDDATHAQAMKFADKLGISYNEDTNKAEFDPAMLQSMIMGMATNPGGEDFSSIINIGKTMGSSMGVDMDSMQAALAQHMMPPGAAEKPTPKPRKKKVDAKPPGTNRSSSKHTS